MLSKILLPAAPLEIDRLIGAGSFVCLLVSAASPASTRTCSLINLDSTTPLEMVLWLTKYNGPDGVVVPKDNYRNLLLGR